MHLQALGLRMIRAPAAVHVLAATCSLIHLAAASAPVAEGLQLEPAPIYVAADIASVEFDYEGAGASPIAAEPYEPAMEPPVEPVVEPADELVIEPLPGPVQQDPPIAEPPSATDVEPDEGDLRLVSQVEVNGFVTGALQVFLDGAYGAVCNTFFGPEDAAVACRQLGFEGGVFARLPSVFLGRSPELPMQDNSTLAAFVLENLDCDGTEKHLLDCPGAVTELEYGSYPSYGPSNPSMSTYTYEGGSGGCEGQGSLTFVACGTLTAPERGDLRLAHGAASEDDKSMYGRLEIFYNGGWGSVCESLDSSPPPSQRLNNAPFTDAAVDLACMQLGFDKGEKIFLPVDRGLEKTRIPIVLAGAECDGTESALTDCTGPPAGGLGGITEQCGLKDVVSLTCLRDGPTGAGMNGSLRLMDGQNGPGYEYGRLEIFLRGFWNTICDDPSTSRTTRSIFPAAGSSFTPDAAQVACSILGYSGGASLEFRQAYNSRRSPSPTNKVLVANLPVGLASVDCEGNETSLLQCSSIPEDRKKCSVRSNATDSVVLACANSTASCPAPPPPVQGSVRLRGGFGTPCDAVHTGFVEVFNDGEWGAICQGGGPNTAEFLAGDVVCRQLGFPHGTTIDPSTNPREGERIFFNDYSYNTYGFGGITDEAEEPQGLFWLEGVFCSGSEERLVECDLGQGFRRNTPQCEFNAVRLTVACRTFAVPEALEDVTTPGAEEGDARLVGISEVANWQVGRFEVFFEGSWSQVCAGDFDPDDVAVACRQLGFGAGAAGPFLNDQAVDAGVVQLVFPEVAIGRPNCTGTEASLLACPLSQERLRPVTARCLTSGDPGLMLSCVRESEPGVEGAIRLTDGGGSDDPAAGLGVFEIFHAGAWGTVCRSGIGALPQATAVVACRQLGFQEGVFRGVDSTRIAADVTLLPSWLGRIQCVGDENNVQQCGLTFGDATRCGLGDGEKQRLACTNDTGFARQGARLIGGSSDPGGAWAYGRLEVFNGAFYTSPENGEVGRRVAHASCRSLGFATGAQLLAGTGSGLPGVDGTAALYGRVVCNGAADTLADCDINERNYNADYEAADLLPSEAVALLCYTPSGCTTTDAAPTQGDVRLFDLAGVNASTSPCEDVHFGGVEVFNDGQWGRICKGDFVVDALVICRQLGFPFGSLAEAADVSGAEDYSEARDPPELVWATDVQCLGTESRLDDCFFPQEFGNNIGLRLSEGSFRGSRGDSNDAPAEPRQPGIPFARCGKFDGEVLSIVCRRFEIEESAVIR